MTATTCASCGTTATPGHRFCGLCGQPLAGPAEERRWVTVLFADLVGFTTRSEDMDPEDVRTLVDAVMTKLVPIVAAHGGWVNRVIGDAMLAVFGAPVAHDDDPERAVRAALALQQQMSAAGEADLQLRVGVNTGEVMLGTVGTEMTVMGDAVNTAARLQTSAAPGQVLVGDSTRLSCGSSVAFRSVGELTMKGKQRLVAAFEPVAAELAPSRRRVVDTPLVGRAPHIAAMHACRTEAVERHVPHAIALIGEAGIGKSRLLADWLAQVLDAGGLVLTGRCLPYGEVLGYRAVAEALFGWAGVAAADEAALARRKLADAAAAIGVDDPEVLDHLAVVAGVGSGEADAAAVNQVRLQAGIRTVFEAMAAHRPTVLVVDDLHWADDALLDLLENLVQRTGEVPLLVVAAARPELIEVRPWWGKPHERRTDVVLDSLDAVSCARLSTALCTRYNIPLDRAEEIEAAAGGNPLFAEEVAAVLAARIDDPTAELPGSLRASIAARLDTLPADERGVLGLASMVGQRFWSAALEALGAGEGAAELLERIELRGLIHRQNASGLGSVDGWAFKHGLIRDVAYEMLPRARRRDLHGTLLDWIAERSGDRLETNLGVLAHHATVAERFEEALRYLDAAAEAARRVGAHRAEAQRLAEALTVADRLGRTDLTASLHARRGRAWARIGAWADARAALEAALAVEDAPLPAYERAEVEVELAEVCFWLADTVAQRSHSTAGMALADEVGRADLAAAALATLAQAQQSEGDLAGEKETFRAAIRRAGGFTSGPLAGAPLAFYLAGDISEALALAEQAAAATNETRDIAFTMWALSYLGLALAANGRYSEADAVYRRARQYGDEYGAKPLTCRAIAMSSGFRHDVGDSVGALILAGEAVERAAAVNFAPTFLQAKIDQLFAHARAGEPGRARTLIVEVEEGIETLNNWHEWLWRLRAATARAELSLAADDPEAALPFALDALERARRHGRRKYEADALACLGRAHAQAGRREEARTALREALTVASGVGDPALLLRVAAPTLAAREDDPEALGAVETATERIRAGLPAEMVVPFESYRSRLLAGAP